MNKQHRHSFELGEVVITSGVLARMNKEHCQYYLLAHARGNWGAVDVEQWRKNDHSLTCGKILLSVYPIDALEDCEGDNQIWIKTLGDRSMTCIMLPHEH